MFGGGGAWCVHFILCTLYISWNRLYHWKKMGLSIYSVELGIKKILIDWVYTQLCWWRWFENFLSWGRSQHLSRELRLSTVLSWWGRGQNWTDRERYTICYTERTLGGAYTTYFLRPSARLKHVTRVIRIIAFTFTSIVSVPIKVSWLTLSSSLAGQSPGRL